MKAENLYHTGVVVDDLEATMEWLTKVAGYSWTDVVTVDQDAVTARRRRDHPDEDGLLGHRPSSGIAADRTRHRVDARRLRRAPYRLLVR